MAVMMVVVEFVASVWLQPPLKAKRLQPVTMSKSWSSVGLLYITDLWPLNRPSLSLRLTLAALTNFSVG